MYPHAVDHMKRNIIPVKLWIEAFHTSTVQRTIQVAQLSLTNPLDALHHSKQQNFKTARDHTPFVGDNIVILLLQLISNKN